METRVPVYGEFEHYLRTEFLQGKTEFRLAIHHNTEEGIVIYVHPMGRDGKSFDGIVFDDKIVNKNQKSP